MKYHLCKNLFRLTWKNVGSYSRVFAVFTLLPISMAVAVASPKSKRTYSVCFYLFRSCFTGSKSTSGSSTVSIFVKLRIAHYGCNDVFTPDAIPTILSCSRREPFNLTEPVVLRLDLC